MDKLGLKQMKLFLSQLEETTKCPVCLGVLRVPLSHCVNGHSICKQCKEGVEKCPSCRADFITLNIHPVTFECILSILPRECKNFERGCRLMFLPADSEEHENILCPLRLVHCRMPVCNWIGQANHLLQHNINEHKTSHIFQQKNEDVQWKEMRYIENKVCIAIVDACCDVFWLYLKIDTERNKFYTFTVRVQTTGKKNENLYSVFTLKNPNSSVGFQYSQKVFKDNANTKEIYYGENCMTVPLTELCRFMNEKSGLRFSYEIVKM